MGKQITHLLWVDLETTGTDHDRDEILEIGWVLTDLDLKTIQDGSWVFPIGRRGTLRMQDNEYVRNMHQDNGLLNDMALLYPHATAHADSRHRDEMNAWETGFVARMEGLGVEANAVMIAGSGVAHFDRRFIAASMPVLDRFLAYPALDVGVIRRALDMWTPGWVPNRNESKPHRALDDVRLHVEDGRTYRKALQHAAG